MDVLLLYIPVILYILMLHVLLNVKMKTTIMTRVIMKAMNENNNVVIVLLMVLLVVLH